MKKLLAAILSISILVSSVTPSLAQLVPASGRQLVKGLAGKGVEGLSAVAGKQAMKEVIPAAAERGALSSGIYSLSSSVLPKSFSDKDSKASLEGTKSLQISLDRSIRQQLLRSGRDIRESVKAGQVEGMAALILNHPNAAFRQWLLRNEFVTVALQGGATRAQIAEAIKFYRENLSQAQEIFKKLPENDLNSLLQIAKNPKHPGYPIVSEIHGLLSSAAALGLLGSKADAAVLKGFYQAAKGSAFEDTAMVIAARGMLRGGAYQELEELAALNKAEGPFWQELGAFVQSKGLPVHIEAAASSDVQAELPLLPLFLRAGCEPNFLNADISQQATEKWLALGTKQPKEAVPALEQAQAVTPLKLEVPAFALKEIPLQVSAVSVVAEKESLPEVAEGAVLADPSLRMPPNKTQKAVQFFTKNEGAGTSDGILYSGLPVWGIGNIFKKAGNWLRSKFGNSTERSVAGVKEEVPGLHDASEISEVVSVLPSSEAPASADDLMSLNETKLVSVARKIIPAVYAGSFDPVTNGHIDIALRARDIFGEVILLVIPNASKQPLFTQEERVNLIAEALKGESGVRVEKAEGLLVDYLRKNNLHILIRGLRGASDLDHEYNKMFFSQAETVFLPCRSDLSFLSSSAVRAAALKYGADVSGMVPSCVLSALEAKKKR